MRTIDYLLIALVLIIIYVKESGYVISIRKKGGYYL